LFKKKKKKGSRFFITFLIGMMIFSQFASMVQAEVSKAGSQEMILDAASGSLLGNESRQTANSSSTIVEPITNGGQATPTEPATTGDPATTQAESPMDEATPIITEETIMPSVNHPITTGEPTANEPAPSNQTTKSNPEATTAQQPNLTGKLLKGSTPLSMIAFSFRTLGEKQTWFNATTDAQGNFAAVVPDGSYIIEGIWIDSEKKWYPIQYEFEVIDTAALEINVQPGNVMGQVLHDAKPVAEILLNVYTVNTSEKTWYHAKTNKNGQFYFNLPDGDYQLDGLWAEIEQKWYQKPTAFTVQHGQLQGEEYLSFHIGSANIPGTLTKEGVPLPNIGFSIVKTDGQQEQWFDAKTDAAGHFNLEIPDGTYRIEGIWLADEHKWYPLQLSFNVVDGNLDSDQNSLPIEITAKKSGNVTGTLTKDQQPVGDLWLSAHTVSGELQWFNAQTDKNGQFSFQLSDGDYQIDGVWLAAESKWYVLNLVFTVQEGKLVGQDELKITLSENMNFNISGTVVNGTEPVTGVEVNAHSTVDGVQKWYSAITNSQGAFTLSIPNGTYTIEGIWHTEQSKWYEIKTIFIMENGQLQNGPLLLNLQAPTAKNVTGVLTKGTKPLSHVTFSAYSTNTDETKWYSAKTDENGQFAFILPDASYRIDGIWVGEESHWYARTITFTVTNGLLEGDSSLTIDVLATDHPVSGTLVKGAEKLANITFSFHSVGVTETWYNTTTNDQGIFTIPALADGTYVVEGVWLPAEMKWYELHYAFEVNNHQVQGDLTIDILKKADTNINGIVQDANGPISDVQVSIYTAGSNENGQAFFTNQEGKFKATLAEGSYQVRYLYFISSKTAFVETISFEVKAGKLYVNGKLSQTLDIHVPIENVFGTITADGEPVMDAQVLISTGAAGEHFLHAANSNENGAFTLRLPDGSYRVVGIYLAGVYHDIHVPFTVKNGVADTELELKLDSIYSIKGKVVDFDGLPVTATKVFVRSEDETLLQSATTDENGEFILELTNGSYTIFQIGDDPSGMTEVDYQFTINHGRLFENGIEKESLHISLPKTENIKGVITGADPSLLNGLASIRSKGEQGSWYSPALKQGRFAVELPDGEYTFVGISIGSELSVLNQHFQVVNGKLIVGGLQQAILQAELPPLNFSLSYSGVNPEEDELHLSLRPLPSDNFYIGMDPSQPLDLRLADGEYEIFRVMVNGTTYNVNITFQVLGGELYQKGVRVETIQVNITPITFQGFLKNEDGTPVANADVLIRTTIGYQLVAKTNNDGYFAFQLEDGTYYLKEIFLPETNERLTMSGSITITDGKSYMNGELFTHLTLPLPKVTVKGILYDAGKPYVNARLTIFTGNPVRSYTVNTTSAGEFYLRVPDGNYLITGFTSSDSRDFGNLDFSFQLIGGKMYANGLHRNLLDLHCPPKSMNVVLKNAAQPIAYAYMSIENKSKPGTGYSAGTDSEGKFTLRAPNGEYFIKEATTTSGTRYTLNQTIFVTNGTTSPNPFVIDVSVPKPVIGNFKGVVTDGVENFAFAEVRVVGNSIVRTTSTNSNGEFGLQLEDGQFTIEYVKTANVGEFYQNIQFEIRNGIAYQNGIEKPSFVLEITPITLKGVVTDGTDNLIEGAAVKLVQEEPYRYSAGSATTGADGQFHARLKNGTYYVESIELQGRSFYVGKITFLIKNNELYLSNGEKMDRLELKIPKVNLKGTVSLDGNPLALATLELSNGLRLTTNTQGQFASRLFDGSYRINQIEKSAEGIQYSIFQRFDIKDGSLYVNNKPVETLDFTVAKETYIGTIHSKGVPISGARVELIQMETGFYHYIDPTTSNGGMYKRLPNGNYVVNEVISNGTYPINKTFTILDGNLVGGPLSIDINDKTFNSMVAGRFIDQDGQPIANVTLRFYRDGQLYLAPTSATGIFSFEGVDGRYALTNYLDATKREVNLSLWGIYVVVANGKIIYEGQPVTEAAIKLPPNTATIQVMDQGLPVANRFVTVEFSNELTVSAMTDADGKISAKLPEGRYFIKEISFYLRSDVEAKMWKQIDVDHAGVVTNFIVDLSDESFLKGNGKARLVDEKGGSVGEYAMVTYTELTYNQSYSIRTNRLGEFLFNLPNGSYRITNVSLYDAGGQNSIDVSLLFTIENGKFIVNGVPSHTLDVVLPPVNVKGVLIDEKGVPLAGIDLPHAGSGYVRVTTNQAGEFQLRLKDGNYKISEIYVRSETRKLDFSYSVVNGKMVVNGIEQEKLLIQLPSINFTGTVKLNGSLVSYGTLKIQQKNSNGEFVDTYTSFVNDQGVFKENYPDGEYLIGQVGNYPLGYHYIGYRFAIQNGALVVDGETKSELHLDFKTGVLTGKLFLYGQPAVDFRINLYTKRDGETVVLKDIYVNSQGSFTVKAADGEYEIQTVTYQGNSYPVNQKMTLSGSVLQPSPIMIELSGTSKTAVVKGQLLDNGKAPGLGSSLTLRNKYITKPDYQVPVDAAGNFQVELPDGAYEVVDMKVLYTKVVMPLTTFSFEVVNGELKVSGKTAETLSFNLPAPTTIIISRGGVKLSGAEVKVALNPGYVYKYMYTDQNGAIKIRLTDGRYFIDRISHNGLNHYKYYNFEMVGGVLLVDGVQKSYFEIVLP
jgi:uncharacterized GH25 family protein/5-hydroxyisourate hydrolase-like protein (transthyretin family)